MEKSEEILAGLTIKGIAEVFQYEWIYCADPESQTIIHCTHSADPRYINGGWVNIHQKTYLKCPEKVGIVPMEQALNIPISPDKHYYEHSRQKKTFTLVFKGIPTDWHSFSLIETSSEGYGFTVHNIQRNDIGVYHVTLK